MRAQQQAGFPGGNERTLIARSVASFFPASATYIIPRSGWYRLSALGAGGSGGAIFQTTAGGASTGGGGGQYAESEVYLKAGTVVTITIGAGGLSVSSNVSGTGVSGSDGGDTLISCPGVSIRAHGGKGGRFSIINAAVVPGGLAGTGPTGAEFTADGAPSGTATHTTNAANASGGGAPGTPGGPGGPSGNCYGTLASASGGGGLHGYPSGAAFGATLSASGDGGPNGASADANGTTTAPGMRALGVTGVCADGLTRSGAFAGFESMTDPFSLLTGPCSSAGIAHNYNTGQTIFSGSVLLGASGGITCGPASNTYDYANSGSVTFGGGSGAAASSISYAVSARGGNGLVVIERIG